MKKIAIISPRFHPKINDGAEIYAKLLALHLKKYYQVAVVTTQAKNYDTWENRIIKTHEIWENIDIWRFPVDFQRNLYDFNQLSHKLYRARQNSRVMEEKWVKQNGPYSSAIVSFIKNKKNYYDVFIFIGYLNAVTYFTLPYVKTKSFLIPLVHQEPPLRFKIFDRLFSLPQMIIPSTKAEKTMIIKRFFDLPPVFIVGINSEVKIDLKDSHSYNPPITNPYILFIGRIERTKGTHQLFEYFIEYKKNNPGKLDLILIGKKIDPIPKRWDINFLGEVSEKTKYDLIEKAEFLINSSFYESLSLTVIEAWSLKKAVVVNGVCEVLKLQAIDSSGGLYYRNYEEFEIAVNWLMKDKKGRRTLGINGFEYVNKNYNWDIIEKKFKISIDSFLN